MNDDEKSSEDLPRSVTMNLWREVVSVGISRLFELSLGIVFTVILARYLSIDSVGLYFFIYAGVILLAQIVDGVGKSVRKRVSEESGKQSQFFWVGLVFVLGFYILVGALLIPLLFVDIAQFGGMFKEITPILLACAFMAFIGKSFSKLSKHYLVGLGYPGRANWIGKSVTKTLLVVGTFCILYMGRGVESVFIVTGTSYLVGSFLVLALARPTLTERPSMKTVYSVYEFSKWSVPNSIINDFYNRFDTLVLGIFVAAVSVSYYETSLRLVVVIFALSMGIATATSVNVSGRHSKGLPLEPVLRDVTSAATLISLPMFISFVVFGEEMLGILYGSEYELAYFYLLGLGAQQILQSYRSTFESFFEGVDTPRKNVIANMSSVVINVITAIPLVWIMGGIGVVVSTLISDVIRVALFKYFIYKRQGKLIIPRLAIFQYISTGLTIFVLYWSTNHLIVDEVILLAVGIPMAFVLYGAILYAISTQFRHIMRVAIYTKLFNL